MPRRRDTSDLPAPPSGSDLGALLRYWRTIRGRSQLDVSLDAGISQRHISFIESGRSVPSRRLLTAVAEALDIPLRERNMLLLAAGYAPLYSEGAWDAPEMGVVTDALRRMLRLHEPFPAVVMDRHWNVLMTNEAAPRFFGAFVDMAARPKPRNLLHLMFDPNGMRPFVDNWEQVAESLLGRVYRESVGRVVDDRTSDLVAALLAYSGVTSAWSVPKAVSASPVVPVGFRKDGRVIRYFSLVTTVGTPQTVAAQELRLECMCPADEATEAHHAVIMASDR